MSSGGDFGGGGSCIFVLFDPRCLQTLGRLDCVLDVHQDEQRPYVFASKTPLATPSCTPELRRLHFEFKAAYRWACPDFETPGPIEPVGYAEPAAGAANLAVCSAWAAETWKCLSVTLEMPFKGNPNAGPEAALGWTTQMCEGLGRAAVDALHGTLPAMRALAREGAGSGALQHV